MIRAVVAALALAACATPAVADDHLAPLAFLNGCWIGAFDQPEGAQDERCYERDLNGYLLRDTHTVLGAGYGGETSYVWNGETQRIEVFYVANDGGFMTGHVVEEGGVLWVRDGHYVGADGHVLNLRSHWERGADETFVVVTEQEQNGVWAPMMRKPPVPRLPSEIVSVKASSTWL